MMVRLSGALLVITLGAGLGHAQAPPGQPSTGYLYPAGGRQGTVIEVMVGGQNLRNVRNAYVSGEGVRARVTQHIRPLSRDQQRELQRQLMALARKQQGAMGGRERGQRIPRPAAAPKAKNPAAAPAADGQAAGKPDAAAMPPVTLPDHPFLRNLEEKSLAELREVAARFLRTRVQQTPAAIAETVLLEVTIDSGAPPGGRELRLETPTGLTDPLDFEVGLAPELIEHEPNDPDAPGAAPLDLPVVVNGQIMPGDVDRFPFRARRGQKLVAEVQARRLIPYLADAVPGWFQAVLAIYDARGTMVAFNDDYWFHPDPVLLYQVPEDGEYVLEMRDSIYRGREDFVYRVTLGEQPFITRVFPLGGQAGSVTVASIGGWNLPLERVALDTGPGGEAIRQVAWRWQGGLSNEVRYGVDTLPEGEEKEPNDAAAQAQRVALPLIVNGRIQGPGDVDVFRFEGRAGDQVVAEVYARRLDSPLDSLVRLVDGAGSVVAWNDDYPDQTMGLLTHHADSYLSARLPRDGAYCVQVADAQHHGGEAYAYRLRVGPPRPDFALRVTPAGVVIPVGRAVLLHVYAFRKEGWEGDIEVVLREAPAGFTLSGGRIPKGRDSVRMTLTAPRGPLAGPVALRLEGQAQVGGVTVSRPVVAASDMMQAFAYRHLVPAQEFMVSVMGARRAAPPITLAESTPVRIPVGGTAQVRVNVPPLPALSNIQLELSEPPPGVTLGAVTMEPGSAVLEFKADAQAAPAGYADNLIVQAFGEIVASGQGDKAAEQKRRVLLGVLPAIPFEIVPP